MEKENQERRLSRGRRRRYRWSCWCPAIRRGSLLQKEFGTSRVSLTLFYLVIFAASLILSFVLTKYVRDSANAKGWVAPPAQDRHLHVIPLPRLGGVAIFLSFFLSLGIAFLISLAWPGLNVAGSTATLATILGPGLLIFLLGVYDDIRSASPYLKFTVQAIAGALLFAGGLRILDLPVLFGGHQFSWFVGLPLTMLWVLAITNAFNLIDGLDGLAAGSALFSTLVVFVVALLGGSPLVSLITLALAGAILGFLRFNFNPATIFLGDCGSLFIGFMLSALGLVLAVLGTGVWIGVQHLNYLEFGELRRVAQRTFEQRQIFVNNLAIRRATEELKVASDYQQVYRILVAAFSTNDFDGFELRSYPQTSEDANIHVAQENSRSGPALRWKKPGSHFAHEMVTAWSLTLDLVAANNRQRGSMIIYRLYTQRDLQLDINLLTSIFPVALADAIDRMMIPVVEEIPVLKSGPEFVAAQAG